jgi:DNA-directed RNA polymerase specialized sigma24 family protein
LDKLGQFDERKCKVVEMRFFGGLADEEIARILDVTTRTVLRDWKTARLWLYRELTDNQPPRGVSDPLSVSEKVTSSVRAADE